MAITEQLKSDIANNETSIAGLRTDDDKKNKSKLRKEGLKKVTSGITSLEELKRVVG
jgi:type II secretory ATPase GspE/PulE/Tfp pilus assembly ATPase PilB-like protein